MAKLFWPSRSEREAYEVEAFIAAYELFGLGRLDVESKRECPDFLLRNLESGAFVAVELTSVYIADRSVPDTHMVDEPGWVEMESPTEEDQLQYYERVARKVEEKITKARDHYCLDHPLYLALYVNEYMTWSFERADWQRLIEIHEPVFDAIAPFAAVVFTNVPNVCALMVRPSV